MGYPLAGIRVVALEQAVAAPFCTRHLADLGADVVKIERPDGGDFGRRYDTVVNGQSSYFVWLNRGKRSLTLDVKSTGGRELLGRLLAGADVFIQNLGPGVADRLGLGAATLRARHPRLIVCELSGYGSTGPYRDRKAFDLLLQGESGLISTTGRPDAPAKIGISIADISSGMYAFSSILAALYERERTGQGRTIETVMLDCLAEWMSAPASFWMYGGVKLERAGWRHNIIVPYGPYRCGDGQYVNLAVQNEGQWRRLCEGVLGRPELLEDARFLSNESRLKNRAVLEPLIEEILGQWDRPTVEARLERSDVPFGNLNEVDGLVEHPQLAARERWLDIETPAGPIRALAHPLNLSEMPQRADPVPALGQHTDEIAAELGYSAAEIAALHIAGAV
ncbi:MAG: CoA transferase [Chloroflexi bacterium]|nr:CoA transferase [Chloroflexota bacterium]